MSQRVKTLLTLLTIALLLYAAAFIAELSDLARPIFLVFLVSAAIAEILFWIGLFKRRS